MNPIFRISSLAIIVACLLGSALYRPAQADRDIVYAARYYYPPGSHHTSHFHLYRINPDGTGRTQLTYGDLDDADPHWSPDGRQILFTHGNNAVSVVNASGGPPRTILRFDQNDSVTQINWLPNGQEIAFLHWPNQPPSASVLWIVNLRTKRSQRISNVISYQVSPDGRWLLLDRRGDETVMNRFTHVSQTLPKKDHFSAWLNFRQVIGQENNRPLVLHLISVKDGTQTHYTVTPPKQGDWIQDLPGGWGWLQPSPYPETILYVVNEHNSTVGTLAAYFVADLATGSMRFLCAGQFVAWSRHGRFFCTAPGRDLSTYRERSWDGTFKRVWTAPLQVGLLGSGTLKTITPGLVWVTGADWRKRHV